MEDNSENLNSLEPPKDRVSVSREDLYHIWDKCAGVKNSAIRARMVANLHSAKSAQMILENFGMKSDADLALQEISSILTKWDIAELYVGDCRISIRCNFEDYKLFIPKKHEKYGLFADLFMFVRVENNESKLLGFLPCELLNKDNFDDDNYYVEHEELQSFDEIKKYFDINKPLENPEKINKERIKIINYLDGSIDDKIAFFRLVSESKYLRGEMIKFERSEKMYSTIAEKEDSIKEEIEKDIVNISKLADAFIQAKGEILKVSENVESAQNFKIECARANLEKLFNSSPSNISEIDNINNKTTAEVMDTLLTKSEYTMQDDRLPMSALLRAFRLFIFLILIILLVAGFSCYTNYTKNSHSHVISTVKSHVVEKINNFRQLLVQLRP